MIGKFGFAVLLVATAASAIGDEPTDADPVETYRQQITVLREAYDSRVQDMEQSMVEMRTKFSSLASGYRDNAVDRLEAMVKEVQASDLDKAIALRNKAEALKKEAVPSVEEKKPSESSTIQAMKAQIEDLEQQLNNFYRLGQQLLVNASFEQVPRRGVVTGWQSRSGNWELAGAEYAKGSQTHAADGKAFLYAGECALGHLVQDVDISACAPLTDAEKLKFSVSVLIRCFRQKPPDTSELRIEFLDEGETLLKSFATGPHANAAAWVPIGVQNVVPRGSRIIRVNLLSKRHGPRTRDNNGYFDKSQLILERIE